MSRMDDSELDSDMSDVKQIGMSKKEKKAAKKFEKKKKNEI